MEQKNNIMINRALKLWDLAITMLAFVCAYFVKKYLLPDGFRGLVQQPNYYGVLVLITIIWFLMFDFYWLNATYKKDTFNQILKASLKSIILSMGVLIAALYILKIENISRLLLGIFFGLNVLYIGVSKYCIYSFLKKYRTSDQNHKNILIIGSKERAKDVINDILLNRELGYRIVGCLDIEDTAIGQEVVEKIQVLDTIQNLRTVLTENVVDELIFSIPLKQIQRVDHYISTAEEMGVQVRIFPDWQLHALQYSPKVASLEYEQFLNVPTLVLNTTTRNKNGLFLKNLIDHFYAFFSLVFLSPLLLVIGISIRFSSKGPILFKQERVGLNGRRFGCYKFRTMVSNAEELKAKLITQNESDGPVFKIKKDPRVIPFIGTFLRKTSLDELPQLLNVLKGEMSLIGPRPPVPQEVSQYKPWELRRLSMKPGITCIWQIKPNRNDISFPNWMKLDLQYIDNWSLLLDVKIFFNTIKVMVLGAGR